MFPGLRTSTVLAVLLSCSCGMPRDPEGTSERIASTHELRVGVSDNPPWRKATHPVPQGIEPDLIRQFAARNGARVLWTRGSETPLVQSLERHELDLVVGGFDKKTHWSTTAGAPLPFGKDAGGRSTSSSPLPVKISSSSRSTASSRSICARRPSRERCSCQARGPK